MNNQHHLSGPLHRCFFALKFSPEATAYLANIINQLRQHNADVAWTPQRNIHLTLRFLGEITDQQLRRVRALPGIAPLGLGFALRASGLGAFPTLRSARVLWAGVEGETPDHRQQLGALQQRAEEWAREIGLRPEGKRYIPHLTLGRVRNPSPGLRIVVDAMTTGECYSPLSTIGQLLLVRSVLSERGAEYQVLEEWE